MQVEYPEPVVEYNLAVASVADHYTGLDGFGRIVINLWQNVSGTPADMVRLNYGYDRASNRLWRQDAVAGSANFDELYGIDGLYRLTNLQRGRLNSDMDGINPGTLDFQQNWTLDPTGNWGEFKEYDDGSTLSLDQTRTSNSVNEIYSMSSGTGPTWQPPGYDPAGNMTTMPQPNAPGNPYAATFDAWQRMRFLYDTTVPTAPVQVQENQYDGRNFRVRRIIPTESGTETRDFYHSDSWQVLQEYVAGYVDRQYVWGLRYIDDLVLRDRSVASPGASTTLLRPAGRQLERRRHLQRHHGRHRPAFRLHRLRRRASAQSGLHAVHRRRLRLDRPLHRPRPRRRERPLLLPHAALQCSFRNFFWQGSCGVSRASIRILWWLPCRAP